MSDTPYFSKTYPYNVNPKKFQNEEIRPGECFSCPPDFSQQFIIFSDKHLKIIKGWELKSQIELQEFFVPVDNFNELEIVLKDTSEEEEEVFSTLDYGMVGINSKVNFLLVLPLYHESGNSDQSLWEVKYRFVGNDEWLSLNKILMLSTLNNDIEAIEFKNISGFDVILKILFSSNE